MSQLPDYKDGKEGVNHGRHGAVGLNVVLRRSNQSLRHAGIAIAGAYVEANEVGKHWVHVAKNLVRYQQTTKLASQEDMAVNSVPVSRAEG
jgi:predicted metalloprotease